MRSPSKGAILSSTGELPLAMMMCSQLSSLLSPLSTGVTLTLPDPSTVPVPAMPSTPLDLNSACTPPFICLQMPDLRACMASRSSLIFPAAMPCLSNSCWAR